MLNVNKEVRISRPAEIFPIQGKIKCKSKNTRHIIYADDCTKEHSTCPNRPQHIGTSYKMAALRVMGHKATPKVL